MQNTFNKNELNAHVNVSICFAKWEKKTEKERKETILAEIKRENKH